MKEEVEVGRGFTDGNAGVGADSGNGGSGGASAGRVGSGGTRAGAGGAGRRSVGGAAGTEPAAAGGGQHESGAGGKGGSSRGGKAGRAGASASGGAGADGATAGAGGTGAIAGDAGTAGVTFDAACTCTYYDETDDFDCTIGVADFAARAHVPTACENDEDYIRRSDCDDGTEVTHWNVGAENEYSIVYAGGTPVYATAFGYVGALCGVPDKPGSVTAGTPPNHACASECSICENPVILGSTPAPACPETGLTFDPVCDCYLGPGDNDNQEFHCSISADGVAERLMPPADCTTSDFVQRRTCGEMTAYEWLEGDENDFSVAILNGVTVSARANGWVASVCGIDPTRFPTGVVSFGPSPNLTDCAPCSMCVQSPSPDDAPACELCTVATPNATTATETVDEFCKHRACPTFDDVTASAQAWCPGGDSALGYAHRYEGCGVIGYESGDRIGLSNYYFDDQSHELVGILTGGDTRSGPCNVFTYEVGQVPAGACADAPACSLCPPTGADGELSACAP